MTVFAVAALIALGTSSSTASLADTDWVVVGDVMAVSGEGCGEFFDCSSAGMSADVPRPDGLRIALSGEATARVDWQVGCYESMDSDSINTDGHKKMGPGDEQEIDIPSGMMACFISVQTYPAEQAGKVAVIVEKRRR